jgi:hypothetical protein
MAFLDVSAEDANLIVKMNVFYHDSLVTSIVFVLLRLELSRLSLGGVCMV